MNSPYDIYNAPWVNPDGSIKLDYAFWKDFNHQIDKSLDDVIDILYHEVDNAIQHINSIDLVNRLEKDGYKKVTHNLSGYNPYKTWVKGDDPTSCTLLFDLTGQIISYDITPDLMEDLSMRHKPTQVKLTNRDEFELSFDNGELISFDVFKKDRYVHVTAADYFLTHDVESIRIESKYGPWYNIMTNPEKTVINFAHDFKNICWGPTFIKITEEKITKKFILDGNDITSFVEKNNFTFPLSDKDRYQLELKYR